MTEKTNASRALWYLQRDLERNTRYHARRRSFFDTLHKSVMLGVILSGTAAFASMKEALGLPQHWAAGFALIPAVLAALDLVFSFSHKARDHEILYRRYQELLSETIDTVDPEKVSALEKKLQKILQDEPPYYKGLNAVCHNEVMEALGKPEFKRKIEWWQLPLVNFIMFATTEFPPVGPQSTRSVRP